MSADEGHDTTEEAIAAAKNDPLQPKARRDAAEFAGRTFVDAWGDSDEWVMEFSDSLWLRVFIDRDHLNSAVEQVKPERRLAGGPILMERPDGDVARVEPEVLADDRRGAPSWQLFVNNLGFHIYLRRKLILCFSPVRRRDMGQTVLWVWEDD